MNDGTIVNQNVAVDPNATPVRVDDPGVALDVSVFDQAVSDPAPVAPAAAPVPAPAPVRTAPSMPIADQLDPDLDAMVRHPKEFIRQIVQDYVGGNVMPAVGTVQQTASSVENFITSNANANASAAAANVKNRFARVMGNDEDFKSNPRLSQRLVGSFLETLRIAKQHALNGDFGPVQEVMAFDDRQFEAALAAAKKMEGVQSTSSVPVGQPSATVEAPTTTVPLAPVEITAEEEMVIAARERIEPGWRQKFIASKQTAIERGDWEF